MVIYFVYVGQELRGGGAHPIAPSCVRHFFHGCLFLDYCFNKIKRNYVILLC